MGAPLSDEFNEDEIAYIAKLALGDKTTHPQEIYDKLKWLQVRKFLFKTRSGKDVEIFCLTYLLQAYLSSNLLFNARGFYLMKPEETNLKDKGWVVVMRGYDKFSPAKNNIEDFKTDLNGGSYYEVLEKINGCLIMISSAHGELLVATKKAIDVGENRGIHAQHARKLIEKHLSKVKKTEDDIIQFLKEENVTLTLEMLDTSFEEHIVDYDDSNTGLYLHGVNENKLNFKTWCLPQVEKVAEKFGFFLPPYIKYNKCEEVLEMLKNQQKLYNEANIVKEGWIVRSYKPCHPVKFYKYKMPLYLMFREWRNIILKLSSGVTLNYNKLKFAYSFIFLFWIYNAKKNNSVLLSCDGNMKFSNTKKKFLSFINSSNTSSDKQIPNCTSLSSLSATIPFSIKHCISDISPPPSIVNHNYNITSFSPHQLKSLNNYDSYPRFPTSFGKNIKFFFFSTSNIDLAQKQISLPQILEKNSISYIDAISPSFSSFTMLTKVVLEATFTNNTILVKKPMFNDKFKIIMYKKLKYVYPSCSIEYLKNFQVESVLLH